MTKHKLALALGCSTLSLLLAPGHASAQGYGAGEIIVTAQKREQSLMDVGQTLNVLTGDQLEKQRITSGEDLAIAVPSLTFARTDYNVPVFSLRGIGFNSSALAAYPAVSFYLDEAPLAFPIMAANQTFDLERLEVLKGPQGTLFGNNATGGAINLIAKKPTDVLEAGISATYGRFNLFEVSGHISGPLSDTVRARIAGQAHVMDAWQKSYTRPDDRNGKEEYYTGRAILEMEPSDAFKAVLTVGGYKDKTDPQALALAGTKYSYPQYGETGLGAPVIAQPLIPTKPRYADWGGPAGSSADAAYVNQALRSTELYADRSQIQGSLRLEYSLTDSLQLTSLTSYVRFRQKMSVSRSGSAIQNEDQTDMNGRLNSFSQELRLENTGDDQLHWVIGGNYEKSKTKETQLQIYANNLSAINSGIFQNGIYTKNSIENYAIFGNVEYEIAPQLTAKGGIRYTKDKIKARSTLDTGLGSQALTSANWDRFDVTFPGSLDVGGKKSWSNVGWKLGADYTLGDNKMIYASWARGFKSGGFTGRIGVAADGNAPYGPEKVDTFELGLKADFLDRHLRTNLALFRTN